MTTLFTQPAVSAPSTRLLIVVRTGVAIVGVSALVLSYGALYALAIAAHISHDLAPLWPVSVDVLAVVSAVAARTFHGSRRAPLYAWGVLLLFLGLSVWGNGLHATLGEKQENAPAPRAGVAQHVSPRPTRASDAPTVKLSAAEAVVVSATPPVALALALHLSFMMAARSSVTEVEQTGSDVDATGSDDPPGTSTEPWVPEPDPFDLPDFPALSGPVELPEPAPLPARPPARAIVPVAFVAPDIADDDPADAGDDEEDPQESKADLIRRTLVETGGNVSTAIHLLARANVDVHPSYVYRVAKTHVVSD